jgi:phosphoribosylglycinamide formyltransferase-1
MAEPLVAAEKPIRVAVMTTGGTARLRYLLEDDPNRGEAYELVTGLVNDADGAAISLLETHDVSVEVRDIHDFYNKRGTDLGDMDVRREFDTHIAQVLSSYDPDLIVLAGYLHILTTPILDRFSPRIINAHHADLTVRTVGGKPVYRGLDAVKQAIWAGTPSTRETTHVVTETVDTGPLIARSRPFEIHRNLVADALTRDAENMFDAYVYAHRQWMARVGGGPTLAKTVELVADGRITFNKGKTNVDGEQGYYQLGDGVQHMASPDVDEGV